jgi:diguanylate cyclase (GGDEF)-like protein
LRTYRITYYSEFSKIFPVFNSKIDWQKSLQWYNINSKLSMLQVAQFKTKMAKKVIIGVGIPQNISDELKINFTSEIYEFLNFSSAEELLKNIKKPKISLIFIYNVLPDLKNCQELCIALRAEPATETVPLIIVSHGKENKEEKISMLHSGLIDSYLSSLGTTEELVAYANVFLQRLALEEELEVKNELLNDLSITDELTKLFNRRHLIQKLEEELKKVKRYTSYTLSVLMLDIDHFKDINDTFGHSQGDLALEKLADLIKKNIRSIDVPCRYGGEEMVVIFSFTNYEGVYEVAQRLLTKIKDHNFGTSKQPLKFTVSIGLLTVDSKDQTDVDALFRALDKQLYTAKNTGRNKICGGLYKNLKLGSRT